MRTSKLEKPLGKAVLACAVAAWFGGGVADPVFAEKDDLPQSPGGQAAPPQGALPRHVNEWLERAAQTYQAEIAGKLTTPREPGALAGPAKPQESALPEKLSEGVFAALGYVIYWIERAYEMAGLAPSRTMSFAVSSADQAVREAKEFVDARRKAEADWKQAVERANAAAADAAREAKQRRGGTVSETPAELDRKRAEARKEELAKLKKELDRKIEEGLAKLEELTKAKPDKKAEAAHEALSAEVQSLLSVAPATEQPQPDRKTAEAGSARKAEDATKLEDAKAAEIKRLAEAKAAEDKAAEEKRAAEAQAEAERKAAEEKHQSEARAAEEKRAVEAKAAEEKRLAEAKAEEARKAAEAERARREAEEKAAEEKRLADAKAEEKRAAAEQQALQAAEARKAAEAKAAEEKRQLDAKAEAERKAVHADQNAKAEKARAAYARAVADAVGMRKAEEARKAADDEHAAEEAKAAEEQRIAEATADKAPAPRVAEAASPETAARSTSDRVKADVRPARKVQKVGRQSRRHTANPQCKQTKSSAARGKRVHVVRRGETLWAISRRYLGKGARYEAIYEANRKRIHKPNRIFPCQRLRLPRSYG